MGYFDENNKTRKRYLPVRGKSLQTPVFFPSISSVKTNLSPVDYFNILKALGQPQFLISAFDVDSSPQRDEFIEALKTNRTEDGAIILMDSGNYESYWLRDTTWDIGRFNQILELEVCDLAFCYDYQNPPGRIEENVRCIDESRRASQQIVNGTPVIPIVHSNREDLIQVILELYERTKFSIVSIPERILGPGILERVKTVTKLRKELNRFDDYLFIHLLGTGNPYSLLLFSLAGADSFDGLEWCQTTVNSDTALLYHFQQRDLIEDECVFCKDTDLDYSLKTLGHNLTFYSAWMKNIRDALERQSVSDLLRKYFSPNFLGELLSLWA